MTRPAVLAAPPTPAIVRPVRSTPTAEVLPPLAEVLSGSWHTLGACAARSDLDWFPPPSRPSRAAAAVAVCESCPVQTECLLYALLHGITDGIWGGMSAKKRARFRNLLAAKGLAMPLRICHWCQRPFPVSVLSSNAKYCSPPHRVLARHRLRRALEAAR